MQITHWIAISGIVVSIFIAFYFGIKKGDLKTLEIYFTPSKLKRNLRDRFFFRKSGSKIPSIGVINFFLLPKSKHRRICFHVYLTLENLSKYAIEEVLVTLTYPRKYYDEEDKMFFEHSGKSQKRNLEYTFIDDEVMQVSYSYSSLHPKSMYQIIHPLIIAIDDCNKPLDIDHPLYFDVKETGFSFEPISYTVTARNLKKPIRNYFWLINILGIPYKIFFNREKRFLNAITKDQKFEKYIFELRDISFYKEGKYKKDVLVAPLDKMKVSYSHFPRIKEPFRAFNFKDIHE